MRLATYRAAGLVFSEHSFEVPLDHVRPESATVTVFAREVVASTRERDDLPWLVFFQGGPGNEAPRPLGRSNPSWLERALEDYRVLLLDQRGTGRSMPVGDLAGMAAEDQAEYLKHFRADAIVRDAEFIRRDLAVERWAVLGQSFGGFCVVSYLSLAPEGLSEALITGGLPPLERTPDEVYRATYRRVLDKNWASYARYPEDRERVRRVLERLETEEVRLPGGDRLTPRRFRQLGHLLGQSTGFEKLHYLLELPPRLARVPPRRGGGLPICAQSPLCGYPRGLLRAGKRDALGGRPRTSRRVPRRPDIVHGRARLPVDVRGVCGSPPAGRRGSDPGRP